MSAPERSRPANFADAVRAVSEAAADPDPSSVLDALRHQAEILLECDAAGIHLAESAGSDVVFRRVHVSDFAAAHGALDSPPWRPPEALLRALVDGRAVFIADFQADGPPDIQERIWLRAFGSALYAPIISGYGLYGLLFAGWFERRAETPDLLATAEALAGCAAVAQRMAWLLASERTARREAEEATAEARAVIEASRLVAASAGRNLAATLDALAEEARMLLAADDVSIHLARPDTGDLVRHRPNGGAVLGSVYARAGTSATPDEFVEMALSSGRPMHSSDFQAESLISPEARRMLPNVAAVITVPLVAEGERLGVLHVHWASRHQATPRELEMAEAFGQHASVAIRTARLLEESQRARRLVAAVEDRQRREIAEVLHADVQTRLLLVWYQLGRCLDLLAADFDQARGVLERAREEVDRIREQDVRGISHRLHPHMLGLGLVPAIRSLARRLDEQIVVAVEVGADVPEQEPTAEPRLPDDTRLAVYRAVEEALNNTLRHAAAKRATVSLRRGADGWLEASVVDDGVGFDAAAVRRGLGLDAIGARVTEVGGRCTIASRPGAGTTVLVRVPLSS